MACHIFNVSDKYATSLLVICVLGGVHIGVTNQSLKLTGIIPKS